MHPSTEYGHFSEKYTHNIYAKVVIHQSLAYNIAMMKIPHVIVSMESFLNSASEIWSEKEIREFEVYIGLHPEAGDIMPGCGGIRKVCWTAQGKGNRGGARVIYYYYDDTVPLYLLYAYPKSEREDLTEDDKKILRKLAEELREKASKQRKEQ